MGISDKAMRGRNGFLFLNGKDSNNLVEHLQGQIAVLPSALRVHRLNRDIIGKLEVPFLGIIVPEAHCLYPEELPEGMAPPVQGRPVHHALSHMAPGYHYVMEPLERFKAAGNVVYTGHDSHWTQPAALHTYRALRHRLGRSHDFELCYEPSNNAEVRDLTLSSWEQAFAAERALQNTIVSSYRTLFASSILNHGHVLVIHNERGQGRCLAFGTSFSNRLVPAYASDFREVVFCYGTTIDPFMVDLVRPDCVISEMPERFLHFPALFTRGSTLLAMILGLCEQKGALKPLVRPHTEAPASLAPILQLLGAGAAMARDGSPRALLQQVEPLDRDLALRLALLAPHLGGTGEMPSLRLLLSGQFYNRLILYRAAELIDNRRLGLADLPLLPQSENAMLSAIRLYLRADLREHARGVLAETVERFGESPEAAYYRNYIG